MMDIVSIVWWAHTPMDGSYNEFLVLRDWEDEAFIQRIVKGDET